MKMKDMCIKERPREKLLEKGAASLDNSELLAILLRTGTRTRNVLETGAELLKAAGNNLTTLSGFSIDRMKETEGIGQDKAATVAAAMELGKRFVSEKMSVKRESITHSSQIFRMMQPVMKGMAHEECWVFFLNRANYIISKEMLSSGGMDSTILDTRIIIRKALEKHAHGLILVHNHPSGNPAPGTSDIRQTQALKKAAETFDISLIDHIIVADDRYYSFADEMTSD